MKKWDFGRENPIERVQAANFATHERRESSR
jgi:hypothetical protein